MAKKRDPRREAVYVISVAAQLAGLHPQTLRIYERRRLIKPYRTPGGTRRYSPADIERLALITDLTEQGLNLEGVRQVLALQDRIAELESKVEALQDQMAELREQAAQEVRKVERSYRSEIVLWREMFPDIRRRR
jgi:MerR family transcriptional regulator/heat shock protein HspR